MKQQRNIVKTVRTVKTAKVKSKVITNNQNLRLLVSATLISLLLLSLLLLLPLGR